MNLVSSCQNIKKIYKRQTLRDLHGFVLITEEYSQGHHILAPSSNKEAP